MGTFPHNHDAICEHHKVLVRRLAKMLRDPDEGIPACLLLEGLRGTSLVALPPMETVTQKDHVGYVFIPGAIRSHRAQACGVVTTCWMVTDPGEWPPTRSLAEHPRRKRVVLLEVAGPVRHASFFADLTRRESRPPKLGPWVAAPDGTRPVGRLIESLREALCAVE